MNRYTFNIIVETDKVLNNEDKSEVMEAIRNNTTRIQKSGGYVLKGAVLRVSREVTMNDIAQSLRKSTPKINPPTIEQCKFYDEAQGRHKCTHPFATGRCEGICSGFIRIKTNK